MKQKGKLTAKQERFVLEYLVDSNATQAAIRAGYKAKNADVVSSQLLGKSWVADAINKAKSKLSKKLLLKAEDVLLELARLAVVDTSEAFNLDGSVKPLHEIPEDVRRAIAGIELEAAPKGSRRKGARIKKLRFWSKTEALNMLGRHHHLLVDRHEHSGPNGGPIPFDDFTGLSDAQRAAKLTALFDAARARAPGPAAGDGSTVAGPAGSTDTGVPKPS